MGAAEPRDEPAQVARSTSGTSVAQLLRTGPPPPIDPRSVGPPSRTVRLMSGPRLRTFTPYITFSQRFGNRKQTPRNRIAQTVVGGVGGTCRPTLDWSVAAAQRGSAWAAPRGADAIRSPAYNPLLASSCTGVPRSTAFPRSRTTISSKPTALANRWVIRMTVLPARYQGRGQLLPGNAELDDELAGHPAALPPGRVLVVGSGQTGCQISEELHEAGRVVFLACGRAPWGPRRSMVATSSPG